MTLDSARLCAAPDCRTHSEATVPRRALDGLLLCEYHTRRIASDALKAAVWDRECELALAPSGGSSEPVSGNSADRNAEHNDGAIDARARVRETLRYYARIIARERGFRLPTVRHMPTRPDGFIGPLRPVTYYDTRAPALARFVARSAEWLAARHDAGTTSVHLGDMAYGLPRVVERSRVTKYAVPDPNGGYLRCDRTVDDGQPCPGVLWAVLREPDPLLVCNHDGAHVVPPVEWVRLGRLVRLEAA